MKRVVCVYVFACSSDRNNQHVSAGAVNPPAAIATRRVAIAAIEAEAGIGAEGGGGKLHKQHVCARRKRCGYI